MDVLGLGSSRVEVYNLYSIRVKALKVRVFISGRSRLGCFRAQWLGYFIVRVFKG